MIISMKKTFSKILTLTLLVGVVAIAFLITRGDKLDKIKDLIFPPPNPAVTVVQQSTFTPQNSLYSLKDSFALDNGRAYYIFELGTIDYVPMNIEGADGVLFNGAETEMTFHYSETKKEESSRLIENTLETSIELETKTYSKATVEAPLASICKGGLEFGIENTVTTGITNTYHTSFYNSVSNESTFEKTLNYRMSKNDPKGYYFYTPIASMNVYEVVVYNLNEEKIEYMFSYSQFSKALPGLYYSKTGFIDYSGFEITFEEERLPELTPPIKVLDSSITVSIESNGADCNTTELNYTVGEKYGTLPEVNKTGYELISWTCDGREVSSDSLVISQSPLVANWKLRTKASITIPDTLEVSSVYKFSPLHYFVPGENGETSGNPMDINEQFDFAELKKEGYKLIITVETKVKHDALALFGLKYKLSFRSNGNTFYTFTDNFDSSKYISRKLVSPTISLDNINGEVDFTLSTENYFTLYMKNPKITFEFIK